MIDRKNLLLTVAALQLKSVRPNSVVTCAIANVAQCGLAF